MQFPISSLPWRSWLRLKALSLSVSAFLDLPAASCSFYRWREHSPPRGGGTAPSSERPGAASRLPAGEEPPSSARPPSSPAPRLPVSPCGAHPVRGSPRAGLHEEGDGRGQGHASPGRTRQHAVTPSLCVSLILASEFKGQGLFLFQSRRLLL